MRETTSIVMVRCTALCTAMTGALLLGGTLARPVGIGSLQGQMVSSLSLAATVCPQHTVLLPPFSQSVLDALKEQSLTEGQRRLQIGLSRNFDQPVLLNA